MAESGGVTVPVTVPVVLSHVQAAVLLRARRSGAATVRVSPDLSLSEVEVTLSADRVHFAEGVSLAWAEIERIAATENACFAVRDAEVEEIREFSATTNWLRSLMPTASAPTMLVSGIPMHRIKGIDPMADTLRKVKTIAPITGTVLDTATGLGYTAIVAARTAARVVTIELDPAALRVARQNPWSRELFSRANIEQIVGNAAETIETFPDGTFARIIHDPPMFSLGGDLYSGAFYRQCLRVLGRGGRMFHYIGDPGSASGSRITRGVIRRLQEAGFARVVRRPEAFGVVAFP
jgi:predicted methyltransferase